MVHREPVLLDVLVPLVWLELPVKMDLMVLTEKGALLAHQVVLEPLVLLVLLDLEVSLELLDAQVLLVLLVLLELLV